MEKPFHFGASPVLFEYARELRLNPTQAETLLWERIKNKQLGVQIRQQHPIASFIADFYCHQARLIIEVDGGYHRIPEQYEYDESRTEELKKYGLRVIRFSNEEVLNDTQGVVNKIAREIDKLEGSNAHP